MSTSSSSSSAAVARKLALVTGGNQGIGFQIVKLLAQQGQKTPTPPPTPTSSSSTSTTNKKNSSKNGIDSSSRFAGSNPHHHNTDWSNLHVLLTARKPERGKQAVNDLRNRYGLTNIDYLQLDVLDRESINNVVHEIQNEYDGKLHILCNNAGILLAKDSQTFNYDIVNKTLQTNYYGVLNTTQALQPLLQSYSRVVHLSSSIAWMTYDKLSDELKERFSDPQLTIEELNKLVDTYIEISRDGADAVLNAGWHTNAYGVSKIALNTLCRIQARDNKIKGCVYNVAHPGYVATNMTNPRAPLTPERGAETPVAACLVPEGGYSYANGEFKQGGDGAETPTGKYWSRGKVYRNA